uniref:Uncharacterized protein n=1 Tax=Virus NIOZ-UU157 TaxID=2763269 RepID=A0A7S9STF0_9VIRU|nr:MAG: hypothetical protein NIOZUU157_00056 [Virus NIOZ-UU157]
MAPLINTMSGYSGQRCITTMDGVNDYLELGHATDLEFSQTHITNTGFTITAWIYLPGIGLETQSTPWINIGRSGTNNYYGIQCNLSSGRPQVHVMGLNSGVAGAGGNNRRSVRSNTQLTRKVWNFVAWVVKGFTPTDFALNTKIYVNGVSQVLTFSGTNPNLTVNYSGDSFIGNSGASTPGYIIQANLGDITVHAKELSSSVISDVLASKNDGIDWMVPVGAYTAADALTLKSWWQMGSPTGPATYPVIYDEMLLAGGTGYNATMINMTSSDIVEGIAWG